MSIDVTATVQAYYGQTLQTSADLKTSACCTPDALPAFVKPLLARIHDEVVSRYYGCGLIVPTALNSTRVLDIGSGSGRDAYLLAQLVGERGEVVGVDMTTAQLAVAGAHVEWHREQFGYARANTLFLEGFIEKLAELPLAPHSFDVVVSNCVVNLSPNKPAVFAGARRLLKVGGEMYFSDVYCDRRLPDAVRNHPVLYGECLGGALYWNDFMSMAKAAGFADPRLLTSRPLEILDPALKAAIGQAKFYAATYRLFALDELEPLCEDYGQAVIYRGGALGEEECFILDAHHAIDRDRVFPVCGNTWRMLHDTRFAPFFEFIGSFDHHFGIFPGCGTTNPFEPANGAVPTPAACC